MLTFGQILTIAPNKWVYLTCIVLFELGSLICGVSPSMNVLIFVRLVDTRASLIFWYYILIISYSRDVHSKV
jgi:MFS family permease